MLEGTPLTWTYLVTNPGDEPLTIVSIVDDDGTPIYVSGDTNGNNLLDPGETWLYELTGTAGVGAHVNNVVVTARGPDGPNRPLGSTTVTDSDLNHHTGQPLGGPGGGGQGLTPGFWKNNEAMHAASQWPRVADGSFVYAPTRRIDTVFDIPASFGIGATSFEDALDLSGGGVNALMRHAVAALLNATNPIVAYPLTPRQVIDLTNAALADGSMQVMNAQKNQFVSFNELGAPLAQGVPSATITDVTVSEENGTATITVTLSKSSPTLITIGWSTVAGTAGLGLDFTGATGTLEFQPGDTVATIVVDLIGDNTHEGDETFTVELSSPVGVELSTTQATVTLVDDDPVPTIVPGSGFVVEGDTGTVLVEVTVSLSNPSSTAITVDWTTFDFLDNPTVAVAGLDHLADAGTVTFAPGETTKTVTITVLGDTIDEPPALWGEWGFVRFLNASPNAAIDLSFFGLGIFIIVDDDEPVRARSLPVDPVIEAPIEQSDAEVVPAEAIDIWVAAGADPEVLENLNVVVADLEGDKLAAMSGTTLVIDADAAGWGWFIDSTPDDDREFRRTKRKGLVARRGGDADGRMDLLSVVLHELGHVLDIDHDTSELMAETLAPGHRLLPSSEPRRRSRR